MKTMKHLLVAAAAVVTLTTTLSVPAAEPVLSPRAKAQAESLRTVPGAPQDRLDRSVRPESPRGRDLAASFRRIPGSGREIDYANAPRPTLSPKNPGFEAAWRENALKQFQVAPLK